MSRYCTIGHPCRADDWDDDKVCQTIAHPSAVVSPPVDIGLVDQHRRRIYRVADEIGFLPRRVVAR